MSAPECNAGAIHTGHSESRFASQTRRRDGARCRLTAYACVPSNYSLVCLCVSLGRWQSSEGQRRADASASLAWGYLVLTRARGRAFRMRCVLRIAFWVVVPLGIIFVGPSRAARGSPRHPRPPGLTAFWRAGEFRRASIQGRAPRTSRPASFRSPARAGVAAWCRCTLQSRSA